MKIKRIKKTNPKITKKYKNGIKKNPNYIGFPQFLYRPTWVEINISNFRKNIHTISSHIKNNTKIMAVVKANAYGHMAVQLANHCVKSGAVFLGVSSLEEGIQLREQGINSEILILGSVFPLENLSISVHNKLIPTISSEQALNFLIKIACSLRKKLPFHLKIDTGMSRIGVFPETAIKLLEKIRCSKEVLLKGIYTHFSCAGTDEEYTNLQINRFNKVIDCAKRYGLRFVTHSANSAGIINFPNSHYDMVRPGLVLYGMYPFKGADKKIDIYPVLTWKSKIVFIKSLPINTPVSYGGTFRTLRQSKIATIPVGYADGYKRALSNKGNVLIRGKRCPIVGTITMDMIMVDVTDLNNVSVGDEVVLIGLQGNDKITAEEMAGWLDTINYEVTCQISYRVPRIFI